MNRIIFGFIFVFSLSLLNLNQADAQCNQKLVYNCATDNQGAIYLRDFNAKLSKARRGSPSVAKFSVVLNKGTQYRFNLCNPNGFEGRSVLKLYDGTREWGSTYNEDTDTDYPYFDFICTKSAVYYVFISFKEGHQNKKGCAVGILSFVGKNK